MSRDEDRLAAALRENLRRRKAQARARDLPKEPAPSAPAAADTVAGGEPA